MRRPILAILGFGTAAALIAAVALGWTAQPNAFDPPALRFHISIAVTL